MSLRPPAGFIRPGYDPLEVPDAPTSVSASGGDSSASVSFTAPADIGGAAITAYYAVSNPDQITGTASASPVTVSGLTNGTSYTFTVWALNSYGPSPYSAASGSVEPGVRAVYAGGFTTGFNPTNVIGYVQITTGSNASDFGDLTTTNDRFQLSACSSSTRGIWAGGFNGGSTYSNVIDYVTIATAGNATDYGDLSAVSTNAGTGYGMAWGSGFGNETRGVFGRAEARDSSNPINVISYLTIATTGTTSDFGDFTSVNTKGQASSGSSTRGVTALGDSNVTINYVTIASTGNAIFFGNLTAGASQQHAASASNSVTALFALGNGVNTIDQITIASTGNAGDFGDLSQAKDGMGATSSSTKVIFMGGVAAATIVNVIEQVTIASAGNATDFGDLTQITYGLAACSNGHGGLA